MIPIIGNTTRIPANEIQKSGAYPVVTQESDNLIAGYTNNQDAITDLPLIVFGDHTCIFKYIDFEFVRGADGTQLIKVDNTKVNTKFLCEYLKTVELTNAQKYERHYKYLKEIMIPNVPLNIQQQIVSQITSYEAEIEKARAIMATCHDRKQAVLNKYL